MKKETVKISNIAYGLLDFFPESDPLKFKIKEKILAILERVTLLSDPEKQWVLTEKSQMAVMALDDIVVLEEYLELAKCQGWLEDVNFLIIKREYDRIKNAIQSSVVVREERSPEVKNEPAPILQPSRTPRKRVLPPAYSYSLRQEKILQVMAGRERMQVADIIKELPGVTKRTIRRDLDDLLKKGKIIRLGEWNKVSYRISLESSGNEENRTHFDRTVVMS